MSEVWRIVLTASVTIVGGVIVYALGCLVVALFVEPVHRLRSLIGEIADSLVFYAHVIANPGIPPKKKMDEASEALRRQAAQLRARAYSVPGYWFWVSIKLVPQKMNIQEASRELIFLSNSVYGGLVDNPRENVEKQRRIERLLGVRGSEKQKQGRHINRNALLANGVLLFLFGLILLAVKQQSTPTIFGFEVLTPPLWLYTALGIIALVMSLLFMIAIFWRQMAGGLENLLKERRWGRWQDIIQYLYFTVFWLVYTVSWLKGLSAISADGFIFGVVFCFGFIWFSIIPIAFLIVPIVTIIKAKRQ